MFMHPGLLGLAAILLLMIRSPAQGGRYRGPGDLGSRMLSSPMLQPAGRWQVSADLSRWQFWWEVNQEQFQQLGVRPRPGVDHAGLVVALRRASTGGVGPDLVAACTIALGKIGRDHASFDLIEVLKQRLQHADDQVREAAALALGLSGKAAAVQLLGELVLGGVAGDQQAREQHYRQLSLAIYGLGLLAESRGLGTKAEVLNTLQSLLDQIGHADRVVENNLRVAVVHALSLLNLRSLDSASSHQLLGRAYAVLHDYERDLLTRDVAAEHIAPAIAKLLGRGTSTRHQAYKAELAARIDASSESTRGLLRADVLALGQLTLPSESEPCDRYYSELLWSCFDTLKDEQSKNFALLGLGEIGGAANRERLLEALATGRKALDRPWAAVALGVLGHRQRLADPEADLRSIGRALQWQLETIKTPSARAACAIALGLMRHTPATPKLLHLLERCRFQDELAGYLCVALGMMGADSTGPVVEKVFRAAVRRPQLLTLVAPALGRLAPKRGAETML